MNKTLDAKLAAIRSQTYKPGDFIIADAKDGDIAFGMTTAGPDPHLSGRFRPRAVHLEAIRDMTMSGLVDIMLMSASTAERLTGESIFTDSGVTPAVRLNDTTDIWSARGGRYKEEPSRHHRTARLDLVKEITDLGLYSITFSNRVDIDAANAEAYSGFRAEAARHKVRHFLEVFNPAFNVDLADGAEIGEFVNDNILRVLAGVMEVEYPLFLKIQFNSARTMEEIASFDPGRLIVGILGGAKGTTRDTFELISQAERCGARVALFGRKIFRAEAPLELVRMMRAVVERQVGPAEAVSAYHDHLAKRKIAPSLPLEQDREITDPALIG